MPVLGFAGDLEYLDYYGNATFYNNRLHLISFKINAAWGWCMFAINSVLSGAIVGKVMCVQAFLST